MQYLKRLLLTTFLILFVIGNLFAQTQKSAVANLGLKKNVFHVAAGFIGVYGAASGSFERMIVNKSGKIINSYWLKGNVGTWDAWNGGGSFYTGSIVVLTGSKNHHFEGSLGLTSLYDRQGYEDAVSYPYSPSNPNKSNYRDFHPAFGAGYRFQKPGGHFLFRLGFALPESVYLGLGIAF